MFKLSWIHFYNQTLFYCQQRKETTQFCNFVFKHFLWVSTMKWTYYKSNISRKGFYYNAIVRNSKIPICHTFDKNYQNAIHLKWSMVGIIWLKNKVWHFSKSLIFRMTSKFFKNNIYVNICPYVNFPLECRGVKCKKWIFSYINMKCFLMNFYGGIPYGFNLWVKNNYNQ